MIPLTKIAAEAGPKVGSYFGECGNTPTEGENLKDAVL